jgi:sec-independent protein translocase protein TatA
MKNDGKPEAANDRTDPVEGRVVNHPQSRAANGEPTDGTDVPPSNRA